MLLLSKAGVGKFFGPRAVLKNFLAQRATLLENRELQMTFNMKHKYVNDVRKSPARAEQKTSAGRIWPTCRTLLTPGLKNTHKGSATC